MHYRVSGHRIAVSLPPSQDGRSGVEWLGVPISGSSAARGRGVHGGHIGHAFFGCGAFRHRKVLIMTSIVFSKFQLYKVLFGSPLMAGDIYHFLLKFLQATSQNSKFFAPIDTPDEIYILQSKHVQKFKFFVCVSVTS